MIDNAYYFSGIQKIGGIENFLYQLVKNNPQANIVIYYQTCDYFQMKRLNKYCTLKKYEKGTKIIAKKCFFNFNLDPLENGDVIADEKILIIHGNYKWFSDSVNPPMHKDIDTVYAVSKDAAESYTEITGIPCKVVYNPLEIEEKKCLMLMSATRLDAESDKVKGGSRMLKLAEALDRYCSKHDVSYQWHVYSTNNKGVSHEHIQLLKPTLDIVHYMPHYSYVIQLSENFEGYNYTVNEALTKSVPVVATPCDVYKELGITDKMAIWLDFDCSNIDQVVEDMFTRSFDFTYRTPKSEWSKLLFKAEKKEEIEPVNMIKVKATDVSETMSIQIAELGRFAKKGEEFEVSEDRLEALLGDNAYHVKFVEVVKEPKEYVLTIDNTSRMVVDKMSNQEIIDDIKNSCVVLNEKPKRKPRSKNIK